MFRFFFGVLVGWLACTVYFENDRDLSASLRDIQARADRLLAGEGAMLAGGERDGRSNGHRRARRASRGPSAA